MQFTKYHALGNDYLVVEERDAGERLHPRAVQRVCARHFGLGGDGILVRVADPAPGQFALRIFNSDGSEAKKSGNGLRIFSCYLWDQRAVGLDPFVVHTPGGQVTCRVHDGGRIVTVDMGRVAFHSHEVPVVGPPREVIQEPLTVGGHALRYTAVSIGNPHCVIIRDSVSAEEACKLGPLVETESCFPGHTNVQFVEVLDRSSLRIEIWERGVGYTLASGTSSCASAAVARRLELCDAEVTVHMPGGELAIEVSPTYDVRMTGPVARVAEGRISEELFEAELPPGALPPLPADVPEPSP